ncbi:cytochrome c oxidase subunit 3 [Elongatibacter sediminis]|uniref:Cytochrome c oxidase subunit 3 n=1 Tax=Elongatibacter sediminis TaxID=3119006 RepID=A0AAW9RG33_9GAMM
MSLLGKVTEKPWERAGRVDTPGDDAVIRPPGKTGLYLFLAVISSMFLLFSVTHQMRMFYPDWKVVAEPGILWVNTVMLVLASVAMHVAVGAARGDASLRLRVGLAAATLLTLFFIAGQFAAWREMLAGGYYASGSPAYAFFYLFTGIHALHLVGGLWFLGRALVTTLRTPDDERLPLRVSLCATYWHYLLGVWLLLFYLLLTS